MNRWKTQGRIYLNELSQGWNLVEHQLGFLAWSNETNQLSFFAFYGLKTVY